MKPVFRILIFAAGCVASGPCLAQAGQQFDLICSGSVSGSSRAAMPSTPHLRVDLAHWTWCLEPCAAPRRMVPAPSELSDLKADTSVQPWITDELRVSRVDGSYHRLVKQGAFVIWDEKATCSVAPFSGMPATKF